MNDQVQITKRRLIAGLCAAALVVPSLLVLFGLLVGGLFLGTKFFIGLFLVSYLACVLTILLIVYPIYEVLRRLGWLSLLNLLALGFCSGAIVGFIFDLIADFHGAVAFENSYLNFAYFGLISSFVFWAVASPPSHDTFQPPRFYKIIAIPVLGLIVVATVFLILPRPPSHFSVRPISFTLTPYKIVVPRNYLDEYVKTGEVTKNASFEVRWPDFQPKSADNRSAFGRGYAGERLGINVEEAASARSVDERFRDDVGDGPGSPTEIGLIKFQSQHSKDDEAYAFDGKGGDLFISCGTDDSVPPLGCRQYFTHDGYSYEVTYSKKLLPHWREIQAGVVNLISGFRVASAS